MHPVEATMNSSTITILQIFFDTYCGTDGYIPDCKFCEYNVKNMGCTHAKNPMNMMIQEVVK